MNGDTRNETDANIRRTLGSIDDFMITSMASQLDSLAFIREGSTKRKEILAKFLDLDLFDQKFKLAKKESADTAVLIKRYKQKDLAGILVEEKEGLEQINEEIDMIKQKCSVFEKKKERLVSELASLENDMSSLPTELIDINEVNNDIDKKHNQRLKLLEQISDWEEEIDYAQQAVDSAQAYLEATNLSGDRSYESRIELHSTFMKKIKEHEADIRKQETEQKRLEKKIKMLDSHEYDPNCKYCTSNKFVKDAKKASDSLPSCKQKVQELNESMAALVLKAKELNVEEAIEVLNNRNKKIDFCTKTDRENEMRNLSIVGARSKIDLLDNELTTLKAKAKEYEDNKDVIENLSTLMREKKAMESSITKTQVKLDECEERHPTPFD